MSGGNQLEANIVATVATADAVLAQFERSLVESGFASGVDSYVQLADTLVGQRIWAESSGMAQQAAFGAVAARARAIHALLLPYVEAFQKMSVIGTVLLDDGPDDDGPDDDGTDAAPELDPIARAVVEALTAAGRPLSVTALRDATRAAKPELTGALDVLATAGLVERRSSSGRVLVALV